MATIKAFTDIEQSKKLAKILSIESADMYYTVCADEEDNAHDRYDDVRLRIENPFGDDELKKWCSCYEEIDWYDSPYIPCWSLAALLSVIPQEIFDGEYIINITEGCDNRWVLTYDHIENWNHSYYGLSSGADNLVDTCYKLVVKLHKQKLL